MKVGLGEIYSISSGGTPSKKIREYYDGGEIKWVKTGDLKEKYLFDTDEYITKEGLRNSSARLYQPDTVLIAMYGATIGATSILKTEACTNQACAAFEKKEKVIPEYLYYFFKSQRAKFMRDGVGGAQPNISATYLKRVMIDLVPVNRQREIIDCLGRVEELIYNEQRRLLQFDILIRSRFVEMFGDPVSNPMEWKTVKIGDVATDVRYGTSKPAVEGGKYPYLRMNNLTYDGYLDLKDMKYIDISDDEIEKCTVRKGDVLFNRTNSIELVGKTAFYDLPEDMVIAGYIIRIRLDKGLLPEILSQYMNLDALKDILKGMAKGAVNQANINAQELQSIKIYIPDMELQKQFVQIKEQIEKLKLAAKKRLEKLETLQKSLMQQYFG